MIIALTEVMEREEHHNVVVASHAGATIGFIAHRHDVHVVLPNRLPNGTILKWNYENIRFIIEEVIYQ